MILVYLPGNNWARLMNRLCYKKQYKIPKYILLYSCFHINGLREFLYVQNRPYRVILFNHWYVFICSGLYEPSMFGFLTGIRSCAFLCFSQMHIYMSKQSRNIHYSSHFDVVCWGLYGFQWTDIELSHETYRQVSNIRHTKSQHLKDYRTVLRLSLPNPLKPDVKSRMKM